MFTSLALTTMMAVTASPVTSATTLRVSDNQRYLVTGDGRPFFWLADTAWELFHRLNRAEADRYLADRAAKGFTVIQAVALAELDGLGAPNAYGELPLVDRDPTKPAQRDGQANDYWDHVDYIVNKAASLGLFIGFLPTWGNNWHDGDKPAFTPENAAVYGEWLGRRYADAPLVWVLGGDRAVENDRQKQIIAAMAAGLRRGDGGRHLITFHPRGGGGSSDYFHEAPWLDFNMRQNGHGAEYERYTNTRGDYDRTPIKPVIDGEPIYEDHPISFDAGRQGHSVAADVRRPLYWDLFQGACGHTYGHHSVWQMYSPGRGPINGPLMPWYDAIDQRGAGQMQYGRWLMESRPMLSRIPDDSVVVQGTPPTSVPGAGRYRMVATRCAEGSYAMIYTPLGRTFGVRMDAVAGPTVRAWWYNPRTGQATAIGEFANTGQRMFTPPEPGELLDWVLVLDDAAKGFGPPGTGRHR